MSSNSEIDAQETSSLEAMSSTTSLSSNSGQSISETEFEDDGTLSESLSTSQLSGQSSRTTITDSVNDPYASTENQVTEDSELSDNGPALTISTSSESFSAIASSTLSIPDINDIDDENVENRLDQPIYQQASVNGGDALLQILRVYVENRLTKRALVDILTTLNLLLPDDHIIPKTKYQLLSLIEKILPNSQDNFSTKHRFCTKCFNYLGKWTDVQVENCPRCNSTQINSFFLEFDIETELRLAFELRDLCDLMDDFEAECASRDNEKLYDFTSGSEYPRLKATVPPGKYDVYLIWYTDGATVSKSGRSQIWPIYSQVVNIHPKHRRNYQFVCGMFYSKQWDKNKPEMNAFLTPFALTLQKLFRGFQWHHKTFNINITSRVIAPIASLDAPARAAVQNTMQYNGEYGCENCEAKGESTEVGEGKNWSFPIDPSNPPLRSAEGMEKQTVIVENFEKLKHFKGVKGRATVTDIPHFDRSKGCPPDYMHVVLLGVMLMLLLLWCSSSSHEENYYLDKETRDEIDKILESIAPPEDITRTPRKLSQLNDWKASELRSFLLYYGPVVLKNRLDERYYQHFLLLVRAIHILSSEEIDPVELDFADTLLNIFVIDVEGLYGRNKCTSNVHQLTHLADHVRRWGPLWVWSAFSSEDHNGELIRMIHGSNKVDVEVSNTLKLTQAYRIIRYIMNPNRRSNIIECRMLGLPTTHDVTANEVRAICKATHLTVEQYHETRSRSQIFTRCTINDETYTSELYTRQQKCTNFHVQWKEDEKIFFGTISFFLKLQGNLYAVLRQLVVSEDSRQEIKNRELQFILNQIIKTVRESYCIRAILVNQIESKVLRVDNYICVFINKV